MDAAVPIHVQREGRLWRMTSADGLLAGWFVDRTSAMKSAREEADRHPGHRVVLRGG